MLEAGTVRAVAETAATKQNKPVAKAVTSLSEALIKGEAFNECFPLIPQKPRSSRCSTSPAAALAVTPQTTDQSGCRRCFEGHIGKHNSKHFSSQEDSLGLPILLFNCSCKILI